MKKVITIASLVLMTPLITFAQSRDGVGGPLSNTLQEILIFINDVLIPFIIGIGFLAFVWGMFQYFIAGGANDESREKGKKLMVNATIGFVVIIIFFGFINMLTSSSGLEGERLKNIPQVNVPR